MVLEIIPQPEGRRAEGWIPPAEQPGPEDLQDLERKVWEEVWPPQNVEVTELPLVSTDQAVKWLTSTRIHGSTGRP